MFINKKDIITILHSFNVFMEAIVVTQARSGGVTILLGQQNCLFVYDVGRARKTSEKLQRMNWLYIFSFNSGLMKLESNKRKVLNFLPLSNSNLARQF